MKVRLLAGWYDQALGQVYYPEQILKVTVERAEQLIRSNLAKAVEAAPQDKMMKRSKVRVKTAIASARHLPYAGSDLI